MTPFDDLTLAEVDEVSEHVLGNKSIADETNDPLKVAAGMMWITQRRKEDALSWEEFRQRTRMADIKAFAEIQEESVKALDPTNGHVVNVT
jgi:hypothetical protein